jgi:hypothetical protein
VTGKASDIVGVCIDPVTAQEMITLVRFATVIQSFRLRKYCREAALTVC